MQNTNLRGIALILATTATFSIMDASMKQLGVHYPAIQVAALRALLSLPVIFAWTVWRQGGVRSLRPRRWGLHLLRGVLGIVLLASFIYALSEMPMSEAYTLFFFAPLLITALSVPILGEHVGWRRWSAIGVGFVGVLIVLRPAPGSFAGLAALAALVGAACYAGSAIVVRILGRSNSSGTMAFWTMVVVAVGAGAIAIPVWEPLRAADTGWLIALALAGAAGQLCLSEAFASAPVSVIAPFEYSALFWGIVLDLVIWGELPDPVVFAGAAMIIGSGLYIIYRERKPAVVTPP